MIFTLWRDKCNARLFGICPPTLITTPEVGWRKISVRKEENRRGFIPVVRRCLRRVRDLVPQRIGSHTHHNLCSPFRGCSSQVSTK